MGWRVDRAVEALLLTAVMVVSHAHAGEMFSAQVSRVWDGDTFDAALPGGALRRVRLLGVNCPELADPHGTEAREFTRTVIEGRNVEIFPHGLDKYGRTLAFVVFESAGQKQSLGYQLTLEGLAIVYSAKYSLRDPVVFGEYKAAQISAMALGKGVWRRKTIAEAPASAAGDPGIERHHEEPHDKKEKGNNPPDRAENHERGEGPKN